MIKIKLSILTMFLSYGFLFGQNAKSDTIRVSKLSDNQVKEMIIRCWPNTKDTIYSSEYVNDSKLGYTQYATHIDSTNLEYGPVLIQDILLILKQLTYDINTETQIHQRLIYQLGPPYKLILNEEITTKNGTSIKTKLEKKDNYYIKTFEDEKNIKMDTIYDFEYSLNEDWAQFLFDIDTVSKINTVLESNNNLDFESLDFYTIHTTLVGREKKLVNGIWQKYLTTKFNGIENDTTVMITDEYLTVVQSKIGDYLHVIEDKEKALNFDAQQDLFLSCIIPVDYDFCKIIPPPTDLQYSKVLFEYDGDKNPFDTTLHQIFYSKNGVNFMEFNTESKHVSIATQEEIEDNLKETDFYPVNDPDIIKMAKDATKGAWSKRKKIELLINYVHNYIIYSKDDYSQWFISVYDIIRTRNGVCADFSNLFTVLARSIGIPCKSVGGYALDPFNGYLVGHAWNEVEINGKWHGVDPTWDMWLPSVYHFKENNAPISCSDLNSMMLRLKSITFKDGTIKEFD